MSARRKPWTEAEKQLLIREYPKRMNREIARFTGHPVGSIGPLAHRLGLEKKVKGVWKPWMSEFLRQHYPTTPDRLLVEWMGVGRTTIQRKAAELGLKKAGRLHRPARTLPDGTIRKVTPEEGQYIRTAVLTEGKSRAAVARELGYAKCTVIAYLKRHAKERE